MSEFENATSRATQPWKKNGRILKIVLFGSYARNDWVDEPENGCQSDYDVLIIVNNEKLTDVSEFWYIAEDKILRDPAIRCQVNIIVHTMQEVNQALSRGEYFWTDIVRDGIALYELPGSVFCRPKALTASDALALSTKYYEEKFPDIAVWLETAECQMVNQSDPARYRKHAAFNLHQAAETAYACVLLVKTLYFPRSHNIKFLRSLAEDKDARLIAAWPRATKVDRRRFELLKRAYVDARYSDGYTIGLEDLEIMIGMIRQLQDAVKTIFVERIAKLQRSSSH